MEAWWILVVVQFRSSIVSFDMLGSQRNPLSCHEVVFLYPLLSPCREMLQLRGHVRRRLSLVANIPEPELLPTLLREED